MNQKNEILSCKIGIKIYARKYDANWLLLNYINIAKSPLWESLQQANYSIEKYRYSILSLMDNSYKINNNEFEFLLEYPDLKGYNRWYQQSNPLEEYEGNSPGPKSARGYREHTITYNNGYWGGLVRSSDPGTLLDGSTYHHYTFYSIGSTYFHNGGIPAYYDVAVLETSLWVRVSKIPFNLNNPSCYFSLLSKMSFKILLIIFLTLI